jgi:hypothetical protein
VIFEPEETIYFSNYPPPTLINLPHRFISTSKPAAWKRFDCCLIHYRSSVSTSSSAKYLPPICEPLYLTTISHRKQGTFIYEHPLHGVLLIIKKYNRLPLLGSTFLKHGRHFDYWNQHLNIRVRVCYLYCHEAGLCCYLETHI